MFATLSYDEVLRRQLQVADASAFSLCRDNGLPIVVFNLAREGNIGRVVRGETIGTLVTADVATTMVGDTPVPLA
jgi:uridylate kinase